MAGHGALGTEMSGADWERRWTEGQTGWHKAQVHPALTAHFARLVGPEPPLAFVPLCGKTLDMAWLSRQRCPVVGVELAEQAIRAFFQEQQLALREPSQQGDYKVFQSEDGAYRLLQGDAFGLGRAEVGAAGAGLVWDRGSLVAINVPDRPRYVQMLERVTAVGGTVLLVTVDYDAAKYGGPPHQLSQADVRGLFRPPRWEVELLEEKDGSDDKTRNTWGLDWFTEAVWAIKRRA